MVFQAASKLWRQTAIWAEGIPWYDRGNSFFIFASPIMPELYSCLLMVATSICIIIMIKKIKMTKMGIEQRYLN